MKPEIFFAAVKNNSEKLYVNSTREVVVKNGGMITIQDNQIPYKAEKSENLNLKKKFTASNNLIKIKGDFRYKIFLDDILKITFDEYELESWDYDSENKTSGYKEGEKLYAQGGITSSSSENLTGSYAELTVKKVDENGKILNLTITNPGKYIKTPKNPVKLLNEDGVDLSVNFQFTEAESYSVLEKEVKNVYFKDGETYIELEYPLSDHIEKGEFTLTKQVIYLHKPYALESNDSLRCQLVYDFTTKSQIPLLAADNPDGHVVYNRAMEIIENKFTQLEKRLQDLEDKDKNY